MKAIDQQKRELRATLKQNRADREYDPELAGGLCVQLAELCLANGATRIACYLAFGDEPDTELFIDWAIENQLDVLLPISEPDGSLTWVKFEGETKTGIFGFQEPAGDPIELVGADLVFIPALAIAKDGARLGKGKGYYDRALATLEDTAPVVAVIFDDELLTSVPIEDHDHPVDAAITPTRTVHFTDRLK
ncbi:MAG: 5-formyltetrahydrofolate cyclo-ligase [Rhodoluna sp.]